MSAAAGRVIINLARADLRKDAGGFDVPIALGMLVATGQLSPQQVEDVAIVGELALDETLRPVKEAVAARWPKPGRRLSSGGFRFRPLFAGRRPDPVECNLAELFAKRKADDFDFLNVRGQSSRSARSSAWWEGIKFSHVDNFASSVNFGEHFEAAS